MVLCCSPKAQGRIGTTQSNILDCHYLIKELGLDLLVLMLLGWMTPLL